MKVIFLDVDGVLNSHKYTVRTKDDIEHTYKFLEKNKIEHLKQIVEATNARLVLSSTWRMSFDQNLKPTDYLGTSIADALQNQGLVLYSKTDNFNDDRYLEIKDWLENHSKVDRFVILDDGDFDWKELRSFWVKTSFYIGLTGRLADDVVRMLN